MREMQVQHLGREDLLKQEMATHSSILAWRIPWTEKPDRLQSRGSGRIKHECAHSCFSSISYNFKVQSQSWCCLTQALSHFQQNSVPFISLPCLISSQTYSQVSHSEMLPSQFLLYSSAVKRGEVSSSELDKNPVPTERLSTHIHLIHKDYIKS